MSVRKMPPANSLLLTLFLIATWCVAPAYASQIDIPGPPGSGKFGTSVTVLPNGNFVVTDPTYSISAGAANVGAVYLYDGATLAVISTLTGSTANDMVGQFGITVLTNGNYVVGSPSWNNGAATKAGAATWCSAATGINGAVTAGNSLVGGTANDGVGAVTALTNGNYVATSFSWTNPAGLVASVGAATWCNGAGGTVGLITASNSLLGGTANDDVGFGGAIALTNGNYVVRSQLWNNPTGPVASVGAVTWGNGAGGTVGLVAPGNSLIGGTAFDRVGSTSIESVQGVPKGVTPLTNGNYVVASQTWDNPAGPATDAGAITWGNGNGGTVGLVTSSNSLVGGTASDQLGVNGVKVLTNGNYVVNNNVWDNPTGPIIDAGAVTWGNGNGGTVGLVTSSNSLIGGTASDQIGAIVTVLTNGNYVVGSQFWTHPTGPISMAGAATWCNGNGGTVGLLTSSNSLVGSTANDQVGAFVAALTDGNYVVSSPSWDNPAGPIMNVGAITWGNGIGGTTGLVTAGNSLTGGTANDNVGSVGSRALTNGNFVVSSPNWTNPTGPVANVGAVTWINGTGGTNGLVTAGNSLTGGMAIDNVGSSGVTALTNGNYVVKSSKWTNPAGAVSAAGAVTWCDGAGGTVGVVSSSNSLVGGTANDKVGVTPDIFGPGSVTALNNGDYVVQSNSWDNPSGPIVDARAVSLGIGTGGTAGLITSANSVLGTVSNGVNGFSYDYLRNRLFVARIASNIVTIFAPSIGAPLAFASAPSAIPNPAGVAQTITFAAAASGGTGALTYSWNFGDTSPVATGASVTHAYVATGNFTATVTVMDTTNASIGSTVTVTVIGPVVGTGNDSDGDGYSDSFETAVSLEPLNPASTPTGSPITLAGVQTLTIKKAAIKLNFAKTGKDAISFSGTIAIPAGFNPAGVKGYFDVGEADKVLTLTAKGSAKSGGDAVKLSIKAKKHVVAAQMAKYSVSFKKGTFATTLAGAGFTNSTVKGAPVTPKFTFVLGTAVFQKTQTMSYTAKAGKSGAAK